MLILINSDILLHGILQVAYKVKCFPLYSIFPSENALLHNNQNIKH